MVKPIPPKLADEVWRVAGQVEWDAADWELFYHGITRVFLQISVRHAEAKIREHKHAGNTLAAAGRNSKARTEGEK